MAGAVGRTTVALIPRRAIGFSRLTFELPIAWTADRTMKLVRTKGRGAAHTAELLAALERRGGAALDSVLPAVRRIVTDVRKTGDRTLLRYANQFDGLADISKL